MTESTSNAKPTPRPSTPKVVAPLSKIDEQVAVAAAKWGRVDEEKNVWLLSAEGKDERIVGQYAAGGTEKDALDLYIRRYLDLLASVTLLESRVERISPEEATKSLKSLNKELTEPAAIGDLEALRTRCGALSTAIAARAEVVAKERAEAKEKALAKRISLVEKAEEIAAQDPQKTHWRDSREKLTKLLDTWKDAQRNEAKIDRAKEDELWKRFSSARTKFDRHRRQYFSEREVAHKATVARKEELIKKAEQLQKSTDWNATSSQYHQLMEEWKKTGRSTKKEDDKLWERFRNAQQVFFDARSAFNSALDEEYSENLKIKLVLLEKAEALLPIEDLEYAKKQIQTIGSEWDAIGRVPRNDVARTEGRMREIEREIRNAENAQWEKTDPEKEQRSSGMAAQLEKLITELETQIAQAKEAGNNKKVKEYEEALEARKAWLDAVLND